MRSTGVVEKIEDYLQPKPALELGALSIVIPVYNSATTISALVSSLIAANPGYSLEIILVNDASMDGTAAALERLAAAHADEVVFVDLAKNVGEHNAVMAGLAHANGEYVVIMDDDFQNPPGEAYRLAEAAFRDKRDIVFSRYEQKRHHWARNLGSRTMNWLARRLMGLPDGLYLSSFKVLSRFTVRHILAYTGPFAYVDGLALRTTRNIGVVDSPHAPSLRGRSGYTPKKLFELCCAMVVNFSILPLRLASVLGFVFSLLGGVGAVMVVREKLANPTLPVGWPSLMVAALLLAGVQLLILGVIGEYVGQMFLTMNGTPQYVIKRLMKKEASKDGA